MVSSDFGGFFFFCEKFHGQKIAVFWPKFTISRVSGNNSQIPVGEVSEKENIVGVNKFRGGVKRKAGISLDEMIYNQQSLFNQQNQIMSDLYKQRRVKYSNN